MPLVIPQPDRGLSFDTETRMTPTFVQMAELYKTEVTRVPRGGPEPQMHCCSDIPTLGIEIHLCVTSQGGDVCHYQ